MTNTLIYKDSQLYEYYGLSGIKNLLVMVGGILQSRTVNLYKIKDYVGGILGNDKTAPLSHYQRLIRYFAEYSHYDSYSQHILELSHSFFAKSYRYIILDGTKWDLDFRTVHLLTLSGIISDVAVPIGWEDIGKKGHSSQEERKDFFDKMLKKVSLKGKVLLADREYVGRDWIGYLIDNQIDIVIRIKEDCYKSELDEKQRNRAIKKAKRTKKPIKLPITVNGKKLWWVVFFNPQNDQIEPLLFFITSLKNATKATDVYKKRWLIECLFKHLKSNGFNLEDLGVKFSHKIELMMSILVLVYTFAVKQGLIKRFKIQMKKHKDGKIYQAVSIFRHGLSWLLCSFKNMRQLIKVLQEIRSAKVTSSIPIPKM